MKKSILLFVFVLLGGLATGQQTQSIDFIHLCDTHVIDLKGVAAPLAKAREHFADGERRLAALLSDPAWAKTTSFALITGDLTDAFSFTGADGGTVRGQVEAFRRATLKSQIPLFLTLGNHDIQHYGLSADATKPAADQCVAGAARAAWTRNVECFREGTYYEFVKQVGDTRYVFLMLDNGYAAAGSQEPPAVGIDREQLYWLRTRAAANRDAVLILGMHIPLGEDATSDAIRGALSDTQNLALVLAGHNHRNQIEELSVGASETVQVQTAALGYGEQNWRRIRLLPDRIEIYKTGSKDEVEYTITTSRKIRRPAA
jgi:3',5'-cyclic AMP phosphodiesterase CpdA